MRKKPYSKFSEYYDKLMKRWDYKNKSNKISKILKKNNCKKIMELACGTGGFAIALSKKGFECEGQDISPEMISKAREKVPSIKWSVGDMTKFLEEDSFDAILCLYDSINYIKSKKRLKRMFKNVFASLRKEGVFIFDINTKNKTAGKKKESKLDKNSIMEWRDHIKGNKWIINLCFKEGNKIYKEKHKERLFSEKEMKKLLFKAGFRNINTYNSWDLSDKNTNESQRILFVCKK